MLKKVLTLATLCSVILTAIPASASASNKAPLGLFPQTQSTEVIPVTRIGDISTFVNGNTSSYFVTSELDGWATHRPWLGDNTYAGQASSKSRTSTGEIRDIDSIYARVRAYKKISGEWSLAKQDSKTDTNAADASVVIGQVSAGSDSDVIFYGTHIYKCAGFYDITHDTSDTSF